MGWRPTCRRGFRRRGIEERLCFTLCLDVLVGLQSKWTGFGTFYYQQMISFAHCLCSLISFLDTPHWHPFSKGNPILTLITLFCFMCLNSSGPLFSFEVILFGFCLSVVRVLQVIFTVKNSAHLFSFLFKHGISLCPSHMELSEVPSKHSAVSCWLASVLVYWCLSLLSPLCTLDMSIRASGMLLGICLVERIGRPLECGDGWRVHPTGNRPGTAHNSFPPCWALCSVPFCLSLPCSPPCSCLQWRCQLP